MNLSGKEKALLRKIAEEAAELAQAALKFAETGDKDWAQAFYHEMADVDALRDFSFARFEYATRKGSYNAQYNLRMKKAEAKYG